MVWCCFGLGVGVSFHLARKSIFHAFANILQRYIHFVFLEQCIILGREVPMLRLSISTDHSVRHFEQELGWLSTSARPQIVEEPLQLGFKIH